MRRVVGCLGDRPPHQSGGPEHAVEARVRHHLDDRPDAAPFLADAPRPRPFEPDLRRGVRAVAELALEPVDEERVALAVRQNPRQEVTREPARSPRKHEERIAHRRRAKPLVPVQRHLAVPDRPRDGFGRSHIGAALPFRHRHPAERARLLGCRTQAWFVHR